MVDIASLGAGALNVVLLIFGGLLIVGIMLTVWIIYKRWKQYQQYDAIIWEKDGFGNLREKKDKAGIFVNNRTGNKRLWLKASRVGLSPDNIPFITHGNRKIVYLLQTGLKNFRYIKPSIQDPKVFFTVGEEDVNWGLNAYENAKKKFSQNLLLQYMPFITIGFVSIIILVLFIYFFKQFPVLADVATAFRDAAKQLALAKSGTVVLP